MISSLTDSTKKLTFLVVVLCSVNLYIVNCERKESSSFINQNSMSLPSNSETMVSSSENEDQAPWELSESGEHGAGSDLNSLDYLTKLKLLEIFLNEIKRKEQLLQEMSKSNPNQERQKYANVKRSFLRAMKDSDRKRPGWELAYGRRKRSTI